MNKPVSDIPYIDPNLQYLSFGKSRTMNSSQLKALKRPTIIQNAETHEPIAVVIEFSLYIRIQEMIQRTNSQ